ncbi:hypothetical protein [Ectobacillus panaciterrae]|uniref:hypothetical protein n=1 Tax=Ectobacillus panaciterrae TaxID=363872 RepID=UPI00041F7B30|nr:hypothetical protein [Ectobacillus panaciterrae]
MEQEHERIDVMLPDEVIRLAERYQQAHNISTVEAAIIELIRKGLNYDSTNPGH